MSQDLIKSATKIPGWSYIMYNKLVEEVEKCTLFIIVMDTQHKLETNLDTVYQTSMIQTRSYTLFLILEPVWSAEVFHKIWTNYSILHYSIVFVNNTMVQAMTYDPFRNCINTSLSFKESSVMVQKMRYTKLNRYQLRLGVYDYSECCFGRNGSGQWTGNDYEFTMLIMDALNADHAFIESDRSLVHKGILANYAARKVDLSLAPVFNSNWSNVEYLYPHKIDPVTALIPHRALIPRSQYLLMVFPGAVWYALLAVAGALMTFTVLFQLHRNHELKASLTLLNLVGPMLGREVRGLDSFETELKLLFTLWLLLTMIISSLFQSGLVKTLTKLHYYPKIRTLQELLESDLVLPFIQNYSSVDVPYLERQLDTIFGGVGAARHRIKWITIPEFSKLLLRPGQRYAHIQPYGVLVGVAARVNKKLGGNFYELLDESFQMGMWNFMFPLKSPFVEIVEDVIGRLTSGGILTKNNEKALLNLNTDYEESFLLLEHLQGVFLVYSMGLGLGLVVLVAELIVHRM